MSVLVWLRPFSVKKPPKNNNIKKQGPRCAALSVESDTCLCVFVCRLSDEESVLMAWSSTLPLEIKDLKKHCEKRERAAARMREQLHHA